MAGEIIKHYTQGHMLHYTNSVLFNLYIVLNLLPSILYLRCSLNQCTFVILHMGVGVRSSKWRQQDRSVGRTARDNPFAWPFQLLEVACLPSSKPLVAG